MMASLEVLLIDFRKAFDSINYHILKKSNLGVMFTVTTAFTLLNPMSYAISAFLS